MKKLFTLSALILSFFASTLYAQSLVLTEWAVYEFEGADPAYIVFGTDVLSASEDGQNFDAIANFESNTTDLWLHDLSSDNGCNPADTGRYTYEIVNDTLHFTLVIDSCDIRQETFLEAFWVQVALGIDDYNPLESVVLFPNPTKNQFTLTFDNNEQTTIQLIDFSGKIVYDNTFMQQVVNVDISELAVGVYFVQLIQDDFIETRRLIKSN